MLSIFTFLPEQASSIAKEIDALYFYLLGVSFFFSTLIFLLILYFAIKYRRRSEDERPKPIHGSNLLEIAWTVIPLLLTLVMFGWGTALYYKSYNPPEDALEIFVVGKQWMWKIQHPEGPREINELHVPVGRPVKLKLTSEDVIHSFFVPAFRIKMDAVPGRYATAWFEATKPGRYHLFCAEYCGTKHAGMRGSIVVMKEEEYQDWLSGTSANLSVGEVETMPERGERLFRELKCNTCHRAGPTAQGPSLLSIHGKSVTLANGKTVTADDAYLRESIVKPNAKLVEGYDAIMPSYQSQLNEEKIMAIIAYLKSDLNAEPVGEADNEPEL